MDSDETDPTEIDINDAEGLRIKLDKKRKEKSGLKDRLHKLDERVEELETELAEAKSRQVQAIMDNVSKEDFDRVRTQVGRVMELWEQSEAEKNRLRRQLRECEQRIVDLESKGMTNGPGVQKTNGVEPVVSPPRQASGRETSKQMRFERKKNGEREKVARKGSVEVKVPKFTPV
jgi:DNA repair exonuclease SbcCD ATPase subunit